MEGCARLVWNGSTSADGQHTLLFSLAPELWHNQVQVGMDIVMTVHFAASRLKLIKENVAHCLSAVEPCLPVEGATLVHAASHSDSEHCHSERGMAQVPDVRVDSTHHSGFHGDGIGSVGHCFRLQVGKANLAESAALTARMHVPRAFAMRMLVRSELPLPAVNCHVRIGRHPRPPLLPPPRPPHAPSHHNRHHTVSHHKAPSGATSLQSGYQSAMRPVTVRWSPALATQDLAADHEWVEVMRSRPSCCALNGKCNATLAEVRRGCREPTPALIIRSRHLTLSHTWRHHQQQQSTPGSFIHST